MYLPSTLRNLTIINLLKPNVYGMHQQANILTTVLSANNVFMCFVFVREQTTTCATYIKKTDWFL
jgi:hypothetical protein